MSAAEAPVFPGFDPPAEKPKAPALRKIELMQGLHGATPGERCGDCQHMVLRGHITGYYKCTKYGVSSGSGTDWRLKWPACGLFTPGAFLDALRKAYAQEARNDDGT